MTVAVLVMGPIARRFEVFATVYNDAWSLGRDALQSSRYLASVCAILLSHRQGES